jgi:hypothetical protein
VDFKNLVDSNKSWEEVAQIVTSYFLERLSLGQMQKLMQDFYRLDIDEERVQMILKSAQSLEKKSELLSSEVLKRIQKRV